MGTLGAGNHYAEVQVVDEIFDEAAARKMGIDTLGQVRQPAVFFCGLPGGGLPPAGHTQHIQANPTAGGPRQSLTSEIRLTPLSQEVPSARTKKRMGPAVFHRHPLSHTTYTHALVPSTAT